MRSPLASAARHDSGAPSPPIVPIVLAIAGFDPASGAGMTADLKVFAAHRLYGLSAITALTVQSTLGVRRSQPVDSGLLAETLDCLAHPDEDLPIAGVKIGMVGSAENVSVIADWLTRCGLPRERVVLDPVLVSSSGRELLDRPGIARVREQLLPRVGWITPNLGELACLTGLPVEDREQMLAAARHLASEAGLGVVATGGHLDPPDDLLVLPASFSRKAGEQAADEGIFWFPGQRIESRATHGTGCAFSSALLCHLVLGESPAAAVDCAKHYVRRAMLAAYPVGRGRGPLHHLYALR